MEYINPQIQYQGKVRFDGLTQEIGSEMIRELGPTDDMYELA